MIDHGDSLEPHRSVTFLTVGRFLGINGSVFYEAAGGMCLTIETFAESREIFDPLFRIFLCFDSVVGE